jgi:hypothetical protein
VKNRRNSVGNMDFWKALEKVGRIVVAVSEILGEK